MEKIIAKEEFNKLRQKFRDEKKTVVLCHGVFDLLHYGHIEHLKEAKTQGDILVVSVTAAQYVNKGPNRPYFNDKQRMTFLSSIEFVDYVILSESKTVHEIVKNVQPDIYVKGQEYADDRNDVTGNINSERKIVEEYGGKIYFTKGEVYSSTKLINNFFGALSDEIINESKMMRQKYGADVFQQIRNKVEDFSKLKVLVIGDVIIDEYVFCRVQGVTMKDSALSTLYDSVERYCGGVLAVTNHLANFASKVTLVSQIGTEQDIEDYIEKEMPTSIDCYIMKTKNFITPLKRRYLKYHPLREEYDKLFSINHILTPEKTKNVDYENFNRTLARLLPEYDVVIVCDYGHGCLLEDSIKLVESKSSFLAVNCQANSSNYGTNVITKYDRADVFVVDERELSLASGQSSKSKDILLRQLKEKLNSRYAWLTLGANGALGINDTDTEHLSAVSLRVKDTVGAGDAFYAISVLAAATKMPLDQATLLGNIAGALKTNYVGNSQSVKKVDLLKFLNTVLNV